MKKSFSLVPVSPSYVVTDPEEDHAAINAENEERAQSQYEILIEEIDHLEFEKSMVSERASTTRKHMENLFLPLVAEIESLMLEIEEKQERERSMMEDGIDLEDGYDENNPDPDAEDDLNRHFKEQINSAADDDERSDIADDDFGSNHVDDEAERERESLKSQCRKLYMAIAKATHPDRCRNKSRVNLFRKAVEAHKNLNLSALEEIYEKVFGKPSGKKNLFERLLSLRIQKAQLEADIAQIKSTTSWALHILEVREGREQAERQFRAGLLHKIKQLRAILTGDFSE